MPNVDKPELINGVLCGPTHHEACACREAYIKKLEKVREAIIDYMPYITPSYLCNLVYHSPSQQLRNAADETERKAALLARLQQALAEVKCAK